MANTQLYYWHCKEELCEWDVFHKKQHKDILNKYVHMITNTSN